MPAARVCREASSRSRGWFLSPVRSPLARRARIISHRWDASRPLERAQHAAPRDDIESHAQLFSKEIRWEMARASPDSRGRPSPSQKFTCEP